MQRHGISLFLCIKLFMLEANVWVHEYCFSSVQALYLREFEDILPVTDLYCLLALSSLVCGAYGVSSKVYPNQICIM